MNEQEITVNISGIGKLTWGTVEKGSSDWWWVRSIQFREALTALAREYGMHLAADDDFLIVRRHDGQVQIRNLEWDETEQEYMNGYTPQEVQP